ncbi:hypothetical protein B0H10DRAFT_1951221 [Mycena sp. CBHHK59/15]|nr:hypothetical protein B0H10DRAFT_1951221 [Mycena sp. CBHHK59/15]
MSTLGAQGGRVRARRRRVEVRAQPPSSMPHALHAGSAMHRLPHDIVVHGWCNTGSAGPTDAGRGWTVHARCVVMAMQHAPPAGRDAGQRYGTAMVGGGTAMAGGGAADAPPAAPSSGGGAGPGEVGAEVQEGEGAHREGEAARKEGDEGDGGTAHAACMAHQTSSIVCHSTCGPNSTCSASLGSERVPYPAVPGLVQQPRDSSAQPAPSAFWLCTRCQRIRSGVRSARATALRPVGTGMDYGGGEAQEESAGDMGVRLRIKGMCGASKEGEDEGGGAKAVHVRDREPLLATIRDLLPRCGRPHQPHRQPYLGGHARGGGGHYEETRGEVAPRKRERLRRLGRMGGVHRGERGFGGGPAGAELVLTVVLRGRWGWGKGGHERRERNLLVHLPLQLLLHPRIVGVLADVHGDAQGLFWEVVHRCRGEERREAQ